MVGKSALVLCVVAAGLAQPALGSVEIHLEWMTAVAR